MTTDIDFDDITAALPGLALPGAVEAAPKKRRAMSAAQRAAYERLRPETRLDGVGERWADPALEGVTLYHPGLRLRLQYRESFRSRIDGEVYVLGEVVGQGTGTRFRVRQSSAAGGVLSAPAGRLRRVVGDAPEGGVG